VYNAIFVVLVSTFGFIQSVFVWKKDNLQGL